MSNKLILGQSGFGKLVLGYETNASQIKTRAFSVASSETDGIVPGDLLVCTANTQVYKKITSGSEKIAGIALATNIKVDPLFPQSPSEVKFNPGDKGAALIYGDIAVKLYGTAPVEGDKVYYDITHGAFTKTAGENVEIPGARFMGKTEGDVTVIFIQYI